VFPTIVVVATHSGITLTAAFLPIASAELRVSSALLTSLLSCVTAILACLLRVPEFRVQSVLPIIVEGVTLRGTGLLATFSQANSVRLFLVLFDISTCGYSPLLQLMLWPLGSAPTELTVVFRILLT